MIDAITRQVSPSINRCELSTLERIPIDVPKAAYQHNQYEAALKSLGVKVHTLPPSSDLPDSVFVEDAAVVLDECAIITRPGAKSRRPETASIAGVLSPYRSLFFISSPSTLDGGDVLCLGKTIFIGLSARSSKSAHDQLQSFTKPYGYKIKSIPITQCLHLKSAITQVAPDTLLINPAWVDKTSFSRMKFIEIDPSEPYAANALMIGSTTIYQSIYPRTLARLERANLHLLLLDQSELVKAEGALTCCSLVFKS